MARGLEMDFDNWNLNLLIAEMSVCITVQLLPEERGVSDHSVLPFRTTRSLPLCFTQASWLCVSLQTSLILAALWWEVAGCQHPLDYNRAHRP